MKGSTGFNKELPKKIEDGIDSYIREREALLSDFATRSSYAVRRYDRKPKDIRAPFSRDADRIIHTRAYARYIDKTQVFYLVENDHITHRVLHVQLVSRIARTIGRSLRLNEDLIEAIALGHDIGHAPYGHIGEDALSLLCRRYGIGNVRHNVQGVRFLQDIEDCDLTLQVLDGILCHDGEANDISLKPEICRDFDTFDEKLRNIQDHGESPPPMSLEGCVVRFADTIAYIGRDIQDAVEVSLIEGLSSIPEGIRSVLGHNNRKIIDTLIKDLVKTNWGREGDSISYSREVGAAVTALKQFNYDCIYNNPKLLQEKGKIEDMYRVVFDGLLRDLENSNKNSRIYRDFLDTPWINRKYLQETCDEEQVRDYIAGMTDRYFESVFRELAMPRRVHGRFGEAD